jgi:hypothetical protein
LVKRRIYLTLERGRDIALRNLLRKVFVAGGFEEPKEPGATPLRRTRVPVAEFAAAISLGSREAIDTDEVECLLANMIYKVSDSLKIALVGLQCQQTQYLRPPTLVACSGCLIWAFHSRGAFVSSLLLLCHRNSHCPR